MRARLIFVATCSVLACTGGDEGDAARSDDAYVGLDVGIDGGRDVGLDVGSDASSADVGHDAPPDIGADADAGPDPGWARLPGFPDDCYIERATHPENVLAFHWEACLDALPGCQMAVLDWSVAPLDRVFVVNGGNDLHGVFGWHLVAHGRSYTVLARGDAVAAAWRDFGVVGDTACVANPAASADGIAIDASWLRGDGTGLDSIATSRWDLSTLVSPVWTSTPTLIPSGDFLQTPSTSSTTFAGMLLSGAILAVEPPNAAILGRGDLGPVVVGHSVLWNWGDATGATGIHISRIGGTEAELYRAPPGLTVMGVRADGTWLVWRSDGGDAHDTLWAAPYRETPPLDPRPLWNDTGSGGYSGTIGDGMFAYGVNDASTGLPSVKVVSLADGSRQTFLLPRLPDGTEWILPSDPAWVTRDEVAFPALRNHGGTTLHTLLRIDLTGLRSESLPAPDAGVDGGP